MNVRVLEKWLDLQSANGGRFEINQLLFAGDTALVADFQEKLCRLERVNVGKIKVMRISRYGNGGQLEEVDCFMHLGSQVAADGGCKRDVVHKMNEGCRA